MRTILPHLQGIYNVPTGAHGSSPQGDTESSAEASTGPAGFQENLRAYFSPKRGGTYALLQCEGQVLRTPLALGRYNPVWRHEVSFKSVQISSDLKVDSGPQVASSSTVKTGSTSKCKRAHNITVAYKCR